MGSGLHTAKTGILEAELAIGFPSIILYFTLKIPSALPP